MPDFIKKLDINKIKINKTLKHVALFILSVCLTSLQLNREGISISHIAPNPHPRLIMSKMEERKVKDIIEKDVRFSQIHHQIVAYCDQLLVAPLLQREMKGIRLLEVSREALKRIFYLSYAYRMTAEQKYANRAISEMMNICNFSDWNPTHFLDTAEMIVGVSIGYDWLYETIGINEREIIVKAIKEKGLLPSLDDKHSKFLTRKGNWNSVCNAGVLLGGLVTIDEFPELSYRIINRSIASNYLALEIFSPDGGYPEGYNYWLYGISFQVLLLDALESTFGEDFGLSDLPGFLNTAHWVQFMSSPIERCFNFSDSPNYTFCNIPIWWFADKSQTSSLAYIEDKLIIVHAQSNCAFSND